jgi:murein DD-endopeptidase MepM/ murein hydrolase activator NlpD
MILVKAKPNLKENIKTKLYEESLPFQKLKNTYNKYIGKITPIETTQEVFNESLSYNNINKYKDGVKLQVSDNYMVPIIESGVVVFIGEKENYGNTVIVEQVDGIDVFYGNIKSNNIKLYDYVEKGDLLGEVNNNKLYLVFQKDGEYLDYKEYI